MDQPGEGLQAGDAGREEDRRDDEQPGDPLGSLGAEQEGNSQGEGGRGVAEVVDQISEQGDAAAGDEDDRLRERGQAEDSQRERDRAQSPPGAHDAPVDQAMGVAVLAVGVFGLVAMRPGMGMSMRVRATVAVKIAAEPLVGKGWIVHWPEASFARFRETAQLQATTALDEKQWFCFAWKVHVLGSSDAK